MALWDFLKRKKQREKLEDKKKEEKKKAFEEKVKISDKKEIKEEDKKKTESLSKRKIDFDYQIIKKPHISEKATFLAQKEDEYVFEVAKHANKTEIKKAIEGIYGVKVLSVNIIKIPPKSRRLGRSEGFKKGFKKAVVKIQKGQKIEII